MTTPTPTDSGIVTDMGLLARANVIVERLMDLEDKPYFSGGRGPSPVHEIRALILALTRTLADERKRIGELEAAATAHHGAAEMVIALHRLSRVAEIDEAAETAAAAEYRDAKARLLASLSQRPTEGEG